MRWTRMTTRRWMIITAVAAVDLALMIQKTSHPMATLTLLVILSPPILLLLALASSD